MEAKDLIAKLQAWGQTLRPEDRAELNKILAGELSEEALNQVAGGMNKQELIDSIAKDSKLSKASSK